MNRIQELEKQISLLRAGMRNLTGRDRSTQQRIINELADELARLRREREMGATSWEYDGNEVDVRWN